MNHRGHASVTGEYGWVSCRAVAFPVAMVAGHGLLAFTTLTLVLLTVLGVGGS